MGATCQRETDLQPLLAVVRESEKLGEGLRLQQAELVTQRSRLGTLPKWRKEQGLEEELTRIGEECEQLEKTLNAIREEIERKQPNLQQLKADLVPLGSKLKQIHISLKATRKMVKNVSSPLNDRAETEPSLPSQTDSQSRLAYLERRLQEQEEELTILRAQQPTRRLSALELTRQYSDASDYEGDAQELQVDLGRLGAYNQKLLKEKILLMFCSQLHMNMVRAVHRWSNFTRGRPSFSGSSADVSLEIEDFRSSFPRHSLGSDAGQKPMSRANTVQLFESVMDEMAELSRRTRLPGEFLVEYLNRKHGLASLAMTKLTQFAMGVARMVQAGSEYARVISGVFGLGHSDEMHPSLAIFLPYCRSLFLAIREKKRPSERSRTAFAQAASLSPRDTHNKVDLESGGTAPLVAVCDLIYSLCKSHPKAGEALLQAIRPAEVSISDFVILKICQKMAQEGCSPEDLFKRFDKDDGGTIDCEEFEAGLRHMMGLWLTQEELSQAMLRIAGGKQEVTRGAFFAAINFDVYFHGEAGKRLRVSCCTFLSALQKLYTGIVRECAEAFAEVCREEEMDRKEFEAAIKKLDASISDVTVLFRTKVKGKLDLAGFQDFCQCEYIGDLRLFGKLYAELPKAESEGPLRKDSDTRREKRRSPLPSSPSIRDYLTAN